MLRGIHGKHISTKILQCLKTKVCVYLMHITTLLWFKKILRFLINLVCPCKTHVPGIHFYVQN